ncbi:MAG: helix-turn-helix transcriptional regulator [Coriobacteriaceae bacterium]|nr:helix-turn-helix transcriptional regulator [Coriobacteriaceae bacterium]MDD7583920.1 helix-turn-helix transcriptional regulator [Coriobacteriaceae bacterium]
MDTLHLRLAREARGLSQEQLAGAIGITQQMYSGYEQGKHDPKSFLVKKMCEVLDVSGSYLLGVSDTNDSPASDSSTSCRIPLTTDELQLVLDFRACSSEMKRVVMATTKTAASTSAGESEKRAADEANTA